MYESFFLLAALDNQPDSHKFYHTAQPNSHRTASSFRKDVQSPRVQFSASGYGIIGHEFHRPVPLTNTQTPAKWAVEMFAYWTKDRNDKGELTGRKLYVSEVKYHPPSKPGAHYTDDKWTYFLRDGAGEKAQDVGWAEQGDLKQKDPRYENGVPNLIDYSP